MNTQWISMLLTGPVEEFDLSVPEDEYECPWWFFIDSPAVVIGGDTSTTTV